MNLPLRFLKSVGPRGFWGTLWRECLASGVFLDLGDAQRRIGLFIDYFNTVRLHSAIGYVTPKDMLEGREKESFAARDRKLKQAPERRKVKRQAAREMALATSGPEPTL